MLLHIILWVAGAAFLLSIAARPDGGRPGSRRWDE